MKVGNLVIAACCLNLRPRPLYWVMMPIEETINRKLIDSGAVMLVVGKTRGSGDPRCYLRVLTEKGLGWVPKEEVEELV